MHLAGYIGQIKDFEECMTSRFPKQETSWEANGWILVAASSRYLRARGRYGIIVREKCSAPWLVTS